MALSVSYTDPIYCNVNNSVSVAPSIGDGEFIQSFSCNNLPAGLSINSATGVISGTPTESGNVTLNIVVTRVNTTVINVSTEIKIISVVYGDLYYPIKFDYIDMDSDSDLVDISAVVSNGFDLHDFTITPSLPSGLEIDMNTGTISGKGTTVVGINEFTVLFKAPDQTLFTTPINIYGVGVDYTFIINPLINTFFSVSPRIYGLHPTNFMLITGGDMNIPDGLTINATTGVLSGTISYLTDPRPIAIGYEVDSHLEYYSISFIDVTYVRYTMMSNTYNMTDTITLSPTVADGYVASNYDLLDDFDYVTIDPETGVVTIYPDDGYEEGDLVFIAVTFYVDDNESGTYIIYRRSSVECLGGKSRVLTTTGYKEIENMSVKDVIIDDNGGMSLVKKIHVTPKTNMYLYKISKKVFNGQTPYNDILVTGNHKFLYKDKWYRPRRFFERVEMKEPVDVYHIELEDKKRNIIVDGVVMESYH